MSEGVRKRGDNAGKENILSFISDELMFPRTYFFTFTVGEKKAILVLNKSIAQGSEDHEHRKTFQSAKLKRTENLSFLLAFCALFSNRITPSSSPCDEGNKHPFYFPFLMKIGIIRRGLQDHTRSTRFQLCDPTLVTSWAQTQCPHTGTRGLPSKSPGPAPLQVKRFRV